MRGSNSAFEAAADPQPFCEALAAGLEPPEPGGSEEAELNDLLAVSPDGIADAVETVRDHHLDVDVEGDGDTDTDDNMPAEVQTAIQRLDAYAGERCEGHRSVFD
ncbi:MAG: hypothetical protein EA387_06950 [Nitriliruptor sp.]|nr:MAG: hypothetical protein EA387_06950 [Nitriliruptor sp.]